MLTQMLGLLYLAYGLLGILVLAYRKQQLSIYLKFGKYSAVMGIGLVILILAQEKIQSTPPAMAACWYEMALKYPSTRI